LSQLEVPVRAAAETARNGDANIKHDSDHDEDDDDDDDDWDPFGDEHAHSIIVNVNGAISGGRSPYAQQENAVDRTLTGVYARMAGVQLSSGWGDDEVSHHRIDHQQKLLLLLLLPDTMCEVLCN